MSEEQKEKLTQSFGNQPTKAITRTKDGAYEVYYPELGLTKHSSLDYMIEHLKQRGFDYYLRDARDE